MFEKKLYLVPYLGVERKSTRAVERPYYDIDDIKEYYMNYQPASGQVDYQIYGTLISNYLVAYLETNRYLGKIKTNDVCYMIDGEIQDIDRRIEEDKNNNDKYCSNANYRVKTVQLQNFRIKVTFEKMKNGNGGN